MVNFTYVTTEKELANAAKLWETISECAVDIECENNLHHYGSYITLIQLSSRTDNWIIDVLTLPSIALVAKMLENPSIQKIFHDVTFDFRMLASQFHCRPQNIIDTQLAAMMLGKKELGLGALLKEYFGVEKQQQFQMADWTKRPIPARMLEYAITDAHYLLPLYDRLKRELIDKGRFSWLEQECLALAQKEWKLEEQEYYEVKGFRQLSSEQKLRFRRLYLLRQELAKKVNRPVHFVMNAKIMLHVACHPPASEFAWQQLKGVHPIVKQQGKRFHQELAQAAHDTLVLPNPDKKKFSAQQRARFIHVEEIRAKIADELGIPRQVLINAEQMIAIVISGNLSALRPWQQEMVARRLNFIRMPTPVAQQL